MNGLLILLTFLSAIYFPWPLTALLALACAVSEPLVPLAVGMFVDTLYYTTGVPHFVPYGALATIVALFVRSRLRTGIIK